jgi:hypothetical protein
MCPGGVVSTIHAALKFPTPEGVGTIYADKQCAASEVASANPGEKVELFAPNSGFPDQHVQIGEAVPEPFRSSLKKLLTTNTDVFAWTPSDMVGVPRELSEHRLNVSKTMTPVAHKRRTMGPERSIVVIEEVQKLKKAGILREVRYPTWIANPVLVRKHDGG